MQQHVQQLVYSSCAYHTAHQMAAVRGLLILAQQRNESLVSVLSVAVSCVGDLWELDGRRVGPVNHGKTQPDTFLTDVARVTKDFIAR